MKRLLIPVLAVAVIALGSYAIFAGQSGTPAGENAGMMTGGMMSSMNCSGGGMMTSIAATTDGGVVVAAGGKLVKYDAALKKVAEVDLDIDANATSKGMQGCPMMK